MATKHYFPNTTANTLVPRALLALVSANPHFILNKAERVVAKSHNDRSTVSIIGGGLLFAVACSDIFASPSTKQVIEAMRPAPADAGTNILITNYTGDRLHFGLAAERAKASELFNKIVGLPATDDVSTGRGQSSRVGGRGMPGHILTTKIIFPAAADK